MQTHVVGVLRTWTGSGRTAGRTCAVARAGRTGGLSPTLGARAQGKGEPENTARSPRPSAPTPATPGNRGTEKNF